jgi:hypothetical protein
MWKRNKEEEEEKMRRGTTARCELHPITDGCRLFSPFVTMHINTCTWIHTRVILVHKQVFKLIILRLFYDAVSTTTYLALNMISIERIYGSKLWNSIQQRKCR